MNKRLKTIFVLAMTVVMSVTSCLNETSDPNSGENVLPGNVESLDSQAAAMKTSVADVKSLQDALDGMSKVADADRLIADLATCGAALEEHIASIEAGADAFKATLEAMRLQKKLAVVIGEIKAYASDLKELAALEAGVKSWLGEDFENLFAVLVEEARIDALLKTLKAQDISVDAIISDVEAGLRVEDSKNELPALSGSVAKNIESASELKSSLAALSTELEDCYAKALKSSSSETKKTLASLNTKASALLEVSQDTLDELAASIAACEALIADLKDRLTKIETDLETLAGMIQSLTFISEYSEESAIAYYSMNLNQVDATRADEGKKVRNAESNFKLNYLVRPAAAASALAEQSLWNDGLTVKGYEAPLAQLKSSVYDFKDLVIEGVTADAGTGLVTVTVTNAFTDKFYFKEVGAKVALSVVTGQTDITSKFVEVQPKDRSGKVYAESLTLTPTSLSIQNGTSYLLSAVVSPESVTDKGCTWENYGTEFFTIDQSGKLTATSVGVSPVKVTANATDEWGRTLSEECTVEVTHAYSILGEAYVEEGAEITLSIESPEWINPELLTWEFKTPVTECYYASLTVDEENGRCQVKGLKMFFQDGYKPVYIKCSIEGLAEGDKALIDSVYVVTKQPKSISIEGLPSNTDQITKKINETFTLSASMHPTGVSLDYFRIIYESGNQEVAKVGFDNGYVECLDLGTAWIDVTATTALSHNYFYPERDEIKRQVAVNVEPYWVASVYIPSSITLNPGDETTITPTFTSDVENVPPTRNDVVWSVVDNSDNAIEFDVKTGKITAVKAGVAKIKVITAGDWTTPNDAEDAKWAECSVVVEEKSAAAAQIGDFFYSDGTYGSSATSSSGAKAIGVIFSTTNPTLADVKLPATCTHGLVVATDQYVSDLGYFSTNSTPQIKNYGGTALFDTDVANGYSNTVAINAWSMDKGVASGTGGRYYGEMFRSDSYGVPGKHTASVASPANASAWYIPSYREMQMIYENLDVINNSLNAAGGTAVAGDYWLSTFVEYYTKDYTIDYFKPWSASTGNWVSTMWTTSYGATYEKNVRVVLAF